MATLADSLVEAARLTPHRTVLVDGDVRVDCEALHTQASTLAHALLSRMPTGSVVSFMLPNWHEAAVVYLAATLAGMAVNPILPSLRERELSFILDDVGSRMIFVPNEFRQHDYPSMLGRVTARMESPPEVVVVRGDAVGHTAYASLLDGPSTGRRDARARPRRRADDPLHLGYHRPSERRSAQPQLDPCLDLPAPGPLAHRTGRQIPRALADRSHRRIHLRLRMSRCCWARRQC